MHRMVTATSQSSFVASNERERLLELYAGLVAQRGFDSVTLGELALCAGVPTEIVSEHFSDELDCAMAACDAAMAQCFSATAQAFLSTPGDCPLAARAALQAMLESMAGMPAFVHLVLIEYPRLGERAQARRRDYLEQFAEFLGPGFAAVELPLDPEVLSLVIAGGIYEVLSRHYIEGRLGELPDALPAITFLTVAPFFGLDEARRVSSPTQKRC